MGRDWQFLICLTWTGFIVVLKAILPAVLFVFGVFFLFFGIFRTQYELLYLIVILLISFVIFCLGLLLIIVKKEIRSSFNLYVWFFVVTLSFFLVSNFSISW